MSLTAALLDAMLAAGTSAEALVAVMKADIAERDAALAIKREKDATRQARKRAQPENVTRSHAESRGQAVTPCDIADPALSRPLPPQTPPSPTHTHPDITTRARASSLAKPNGFARFWEAYPNKTGKGAAERAFAKALTKIGGHDPPGVMLAALERVKPTWRDSQFIPHPATWLNQERWEDEPPEPISLNDHRPRHSQPASPKLQHLADVGEAMRAACRPSGGGLGG